MATYSVTTSNWNSPAFWSGITETSGGHSLDFSGLGSDYTVTFDDQIGLVTISDGTDSFEIGDATTSSGSADVSLGGSTELHYFTKIIGSDGDDELSHVPGNSSLVGGAGNDTLISGFGDDTLEGGAGSDAFVVGLGRETIVGGESADDMDVIDISAADDALNVSFSGDESGSYVDSDGDSGIFDEVEGFVLSSGDDTVDASAASSQGVFAIGRDGDDSLVGGGGDDTFIGSAGADSLTGNAGADSLSAGLGADVVSAGDGQDTVDGGTGSDDLSMGSGDDLAAGGSGRDTLDGGSGNDTLYGDDFDFGTDAGTLSAFDFAAVSASGDVGTGVIGQYAVYDNIGTTSEGIVVQARMTILDADDPSIDVEFRANSVYLNADGDTDAGSGVTLGFEFFDQATGEPIKINGAFSFHDVDTTDESVTALSADVTSVTLSNAPATSLTAGDSGEQLSASSDSSSSDVTEEDHWAQFAYTGQHQLVFEVTSRGSGTNYGFSSSGFSTPGTTILATPEAQDDSIDGGDGNDLIFGMAGDDTLSGEDGRDTLNGGAEDDVIDGGADADVITFEDGYGADTVAGGEAVTTGSDFDRLDFSGVMDTGVSVTMTGAETGTASSGSDSVTFAEIEALTLSDQNDVFTGDIGADSVFGGAGRDTLLGGDGNDTLDGGDDSDSIVGGDGADLIEAGGGLGDNNDTVYGGAGNDTITSSSTDYDSDDKLYGEAGHDSITGSGGADTIDGGTGDDTLVGGTDWDTIIGGAGDDSMEGGRDSDSFVLSDGFGLDTIIGGETGSDDDTIDGSALTGAVTVDLTGSESGSLTSGANTATFSEIETVVLGAGRDTLVLADGSGDDSVEAFDLTDSGDGSTNDQLDVSGLTSDGGTTPITTKDVVVTSSAGGDAVLTFPGGESLTLIGVSATDIDDPAELEAIGIPAEPAVSGTKYIVEGTGGDDTIDAAYALDPEGDKIDALDHSDSSDADLVYGFGGDDVISSGAEADTVFGGAGADTIDGGAGGDVLHGDGGDDSIAVGGGDTVTGGDGDDIFHIDSALLDGTAGFVTGGEMAETGGDTLSSGDYSGPVTLDLSAGGGGDSESGTLQLGTTTISFDEIETVATGAGADTIIGSDGDDSISTGAGADTVAVGAGDDLIDIGAVDGSNDLIDLDDGDGNDSIIGFEAPIDNGDGTFTGRDVFDLSDLTDDSGNPVTVEDVTVGDTNGDGSGDAVLSFPDGTSLTLIGVPVTDISDPKQLAAIGVPGSTGDFVVTGTAGDDLMDERYFSDPEGDLINNNDHSDGSNDDEVLAGDGNDTVLSGVGNDSILSELGDDSVVADDGDDTVRGGDGADTVEGGFGDDSIHGNDGADSLLGGDGSDSIYGEIGNDYVDGGADDDTIEGNEGDDTLVGGAGDDWLRGSYDDDALYGGTGNDYLWGGFGDDTFHIENNFGNDTVDAEGVFETAGDTLDLSAVTDALEIDLTSANPEAGFVSDGVSTLQFDEIETLVLGGGTDTLILADFGGSDTVSGFAAPTDNGDGSFSGQDLVDVTGLHDDDGDLVDTDDVTVSDDGSGNAVLTFPGGVVLTLDGVAVADINTPAQLNAIGVPLGAVTTDYVVSGTSGDDVIDAVYLGDPDGDLIDNADFSDGSDDDSVQAGAGDDTIYAGAGDDTIQGEQGDDRFVIGGGLDNDSLIGGEAGETAGDEIDLSGLSSDLSVSFSGDETGTISDGLNTTRFEEIETITLGTGDDIVLGSAGGDHIAGNGGADTITGGAGDDTIALGASDGAMDELIVEDGFGSDLVQEFEAPTDNGDGSYTGNDQLDVTALTNSGGDPVDTDDVSVTDTNGDGSGDAILSFPNGESLTLVGVPPAAVSSPEQLTALGIPLAPVVPVPVPGIVEGDTGDNLIDGSYTGDPDGDVVDGGDGPSGGDVDTISGGAGNDTVLAGDDTDLVMGDAGDDVLHGQGGDDTLDGGTGGDTLLGGLGVDVLSGGADADVFELTDGFGDDTIDGGATVTTGIDNDTLDASGLTGPASVILTGTGDGTLSHGGDSAIFADIETILLSGGDDSIDASASSSGVVVGSGVGDDTLRGGDGADSYLGGAGDDLLIGGDGDDSLEGGDDDDTLIGGAGSDTLLGGDGDDILAVGDGDVALGGDGDDVFNIGPDDVSGGSLSVTGGETGETIGDTLNITGPATITMTGAEAGTVDWLDGSSMVFSEIENINYVPCFTPGTLIKTLLGEVDAADVGIGDMILTRDNGYQPVLWAGTKVLGRADIAADPSLQPIRIAKGALGQNRPERDMTVSPQHRIIMSGYAIELLFGQDEVLVAATHLVGRPGITREVPAQGVTYVHFMFDQHELVLSDGCWTESFQPGDLSLAGLDMDQRDELLVMFPHLVTPQGREAFSAARMSLKAYQARLLIEV